MRYILSSKTAARLALLAVLPLLAVAVWVFAAQEGLAGPEATAFVDERVQLLLFAAAMVVAAIWVWMGTVIELGRARHQVESLKMNLAKLAAGKLTEPVPVPSNEFGPLSQSINGLLASLKTKGQNSEYQTRVLQAERDKLAVVLDGMGYGVVALRGGVIVLANAAAAKLVGTVPRMLINARAADAFGWTSGNQPYQLVIPRDGTTRHDEVVIAGSRGRQVPASLLVKPVIGDPSGIDMVVAIHDRSSGAQGSARLDFLAMAAHELRTPLTAIRGYLGLIDKGAKLPATEHLFLKRALVSSAELVTQINNMLNVSRLEQRSLAMVFNRIDWASLASMAAADYKFAAAEKGIKLSYKGAKEGAWVAGDQSALREVLANLIINAIHFTEPKGKIIISLHEQGGRVVTEVTDTGAGLPPEAIPHLFTRQSAASGGARSHGPGLGLYVSRAIVELHQGTIEAESHEGAGSTFRFSLPSFSQKDYDRLIKPGKTPLVRK